MKPGIFKISMAAACCLSLSLLPAQADICSGLEPLLEAVEWSDGSKLSNPVAIGEGETECYYLPDDIFDMDEAGCYWNNTAINQYTNSDTVRIGEKLKTCSFLKFYGKSDYDDGVEYEFIYADFTTLFLGNDDEGLYIEIAPDF